MVPSLNENGTFLGGKKFPLLGAKNCFFGATKWQIHGQPAKKLDFLGVIGLPFLAQKNALWSQKEQIALLVQESLVSFSVGATYFRKESFRGLKDKTWRSRTSHGAKSERKLHFIRGRKMPSAGPKKSLFRYEEMANRWRPHRKT